MLSKYVTNLPGMVDSGLVVNYGRHRLLPPVYYDTETSSLFNINQLVSGKKIMQEPPSNLTLAEGYRHIFKPHLSWLYVVHF